MPTAPPSFRKARPQPELRGNCSERGYDWQWMKLSKLIRQQRPVCEVCNNAPTDDVDHIKPFKGLSDPLRTLVSNLRAICRACHNRKTHAHGDARGGGRNLGSGDDG